MHGVIIALEFICLIGIVGLAGVIAILLVVLAKMIADKTGDDDDQET